MKLVQSIALILFLFSSLFYSSCEIQGCTDPLANNYNASATEDNGSCEYTVILGCTDTASTNYDPEATVDDGSCEYIAEAIFYSNSLQYFDYIRVNLGNGSFNEIKVESATAPDCGTANNANFELEPGTYNYTALRTAGQAETWEGSFTLEPNDCKQILLETPNDLNVNYQFRTPVGGMDNNQIIVINNCDVEYEFTHKDLSTFRAESFIVPANSARSSIIFWDSTWEVYFKAKSGSTTKTGCLGRYYNIEEEFSMSAGRRLEITIG